MHRKTSCDWQDTVLGRVVLLLEYCIGLIVLLVILQEIFKIAGFDFSSFGFTSSNTLRNSIGCSLLPHMKNWLIFSSKEIILPSAASLL